MSVVSLGIAATPLPVLSDQSLQDLTLLLIEDNDRLFQALASPLRQWGATVIALESTLDSNLEAVLESVPSIPENDRVRGREIDLVIIDEHFVELEGLEWVQSLSRKPQVEAIPVVIMTTVSDQLREGWDPNGRSSGQRDLGHDSGKGNLAPTGNYGYLLKPITPNQLIKVLSQLSQTRFLAVFNEDEDLQGESSEPIWSTSTQLLVVEDSDINQAVIQGFLEILGLQIDCAASGQEALQILQRRTQEPYPLILMDCQMPEMDGYETTRQIRQGRAGEGYRQVPIIALTAHAMPDDREKCLAAGMNDYLPKPLTLRDLKTTLKQWLTDHPSEDNSDHPPPSPSNFPASIPLFDAEGLLDRTEGHRDLAEMMCQRFLEGIPPTLQELKTIVYAGDLRSAENPIATFNIEAIERYAHRLKGSASLIGAEAFRYQAAQLEAQAKQTDRRSSLYPPEILDMIEILCLLFDQTQTEIDRWLLNL